MLCGADLVLGLFVCVFADPSFVWRLRFVFLFSPPASAPSGANVRCGVPGPRGLRLGEGG